MRSRNGARRSLAALGALMLLVMALIRIATMGVPTARHTAVAEMPPAAAHGP